MRDGPVELAFGHLVEKSIPISRSPEILRSSSPHLPQDRMDSSLLPLSFQPSRREQKI
jgi:hypothetical protein